jgi:hypothetical protein
MPTKKISKAGGFFSANYSKFVGKLLFNPDEMEKFKADPSAAMKRVRLKPHERTLILSGKQNAIIEKMDPSLSPIKGSSVEIYRASQVAYFCTDR